jgi:hypothetical protein
VPSTGISAVPRAWCSTHGAEEDIGEDAGIEHEGVVADEDGTVDGAELLPALDA